MYTNPYLISVSLFKMLQKNDEAINKIIQKYEIGKTLSYFIGMQDSIMDTQYPSIEIEPTSVDNDWYSCRSQRPTYNFEITMSFKIINSKVSVQYPADVYTTIIQIMTHPSNLQLRVENEQKYDSDTGLVDTYIQDSLVKNVRNGSNYAGNIRVVQFDWFATIHEPFPDSAWKYGSVEQPTDLKNKIIV